MIAEIQQGSFLSYETLASLVEYKTTLVGDDEPWGVYTISGNDIDYIGIFAAASEYKGNQTVVSPTANTAQNVAVTANSYRKAEVHMIHFKMEYSTVDERSRVQAVIKSIKSIQDKTSFTVTLPTGRMVNLKFLTLDDLWPWNFGEVDVIIQAEEYNPFPIFSQVQDVNQRYNSVFQNQGRIASAPTSTTLTPYLSDEVSFA